MKLEFTQRILWKMLKYHIKIRPVGAELFHAAGGRTDGRSDMTKPIVAFRNFADVLKTDDLYCPYVVSHCCQGYTPVVANIVEWNGVTGPTKLATILFQPDIMFVSLLTGACKRASSCPVCLHGIFFLIYAIRLVGNAVYIQSHICSLNH
jgi:hypothetical protein